MDDLMTAYQNVKQDTDLVIALMHHPTDWLTKGEQKYLNQYMTDEYRLNTNIMLQGHIHEKETYNWYNQNHSLTTLVTGMGWDKQKEIEDSGHRYSLYEIDMDSFIVRVNTYVTDKSGKFVDDTAVYNGKNIIFPLFVHRYLELNRLKFNNSEIPLFYPSYNPAENLEKVVNGLNEFNILITEIIENYRFDKICFDEIKNEITKELLRYYENEAQLQSKSELVNCCRQNEMIACVEHLRQQFLKDNGGVDKIIERILEHLSTQDEEEPKESIKDFFHKYTKIYMKDKFYSFIGEFSIRLQQKLFLPSGFETEDTVRIHFRIVSKNSEEEYVFKKLFTLTITKKENKKKLTYIYDDNLSEIYYDNSMMEKSFNENKALLYSLNPSSNRHKSKSNWIDFLTIAPNVDCNKFQDITEYDEAVIPYLSFGISVNNLQFQNIIRGLAYVGFEKVLSRFLSDFFDNIPFEINSLLERESKNGQ